jgi:calcineurin-like phosphoesterase family protein
MRIYVITDTHFNHANMIKLCGRPEDFNERISKSMLDLGNDCMLIHLGDISMGSEQYIHDSIISKMACRKMLVIGNHDKKNIGWYLDHGWDFVCHRFGMEYGGHNILFTHGPVGYDGWYSINIHGHLHNSGHRTAEMNHMHRLVCIENLEYRPIELKKLLQ